MPHGQASVYDLRFGERERSAKEAVWREIGRFLQRRYIPEASRVIDIATDRGYFIRNITAAERWATDLRDTSAHMPEGVRFVQSDGLALADAVPKDYFDVVFMSNYLEHLDSAESVIEQLRVARRLLRTGGRVIVLQPNIKLVGPAYWDFIDHRVPLTDDSLIEAAAFAGLREARGDRAIPALQHEGPPALIRAPRPGLSRVSAGMAVSREADPLHRDPERQLVSTRDVPGAGGWMRRSLVPQVQMPGALRLVLLSFLVLFVELALIRWTGSNIVYLSFFTNFVLLGSFLGIGIGFLRARAKHNLFPYGVIALAFLIGFVLVAPVKIDRTGSDLIFFGEFTTTGFPTWVTLPVMFLATAGVLALLAEGLARQFILFEPLEAYRLDIGGSILGIIAFSALSFLGAPPVVWGLVVAACFLVLLPPNVRVLQAVAIVGIVFMLGRESLTPGYSWSPYYRIGLLDFNDGYYEIEVNGIPHQAILPLEILEEDGIYRTPHERVAVAPSRVLIIGAGNGNDVALALERGADHVDAVEIDPGLQDLGAELHPNQPYQDERVDAHITDGRAFLEQTDATYDLILFALPDSLTLLAGQSSVRLESYLFTLEAIEAARDHLAPDGVFSMYNYYREDWLVDRLAGTLETAFGRVPCIDTFGGAIRKQAVLTVGNSDSSVVCPEPWQPSGEVVAPATDDHPIPVPPRARHPRLLPPHDGAHPGGIGGAYSRGGRTSWADAALPRPVLHGQRIPAPRDEERRPVRPPVRDDLVRECPRLRGGARIGATWPSRSPCGSASRTRRCSTRVLVAAVLLAMLVPVEWLLGMPFATRFLVAVVLWFTPIFIANLVFAQRFRTVADSNVAFGANLLGAVLGGVIEYAALVSGYAALAILVALLYGAAFFFGRRLQWGQAA